MDTIVVNIKNNVEIVHDKMLKFAREAGRNPNEVKLVVVTKGHPLDVIQTAVAVGIERLGENYPEETVAKIEALKSQKVEWHMIGHLQSRKVKLVCDHFSWLHSLDNLKLAEKLNRHLIEVDKKLPVLLEFNVGGEESKFGWQANDPNLWKHLLPDVETLISYSNLDVRGLMAMPPLGETPQLSQSFFRKLRDLRDFIEKNITGLNLNELSMGTSYDFRQAILEGATLIRIGEAILGPRPPKLKTS